MKIALAHLPSLQDLETAYQEFQIAETLAQTIELNRLAALCQWIRFDSRLGEISVKYFIRTWSEINPIALHEAFQQQAWPNILGVLLEFCKIRTPAFRAWKKAATHQLARSHWEQFYIGKRRIAGKLMLDDARFSLKEYRNWGYLAREVLVNKKSTRTLNGAATYDPSTRTQILNELLKTHSRITTLHYWNAIGRCISRRQAERDLKHHPELQSFGVTKARFFKARPAKSPKAIAGK